MSVGSHKDAFKAHQLVKKIVKQSPSSLLSKMAADILLDFVKNQRQVTSDSVLDSLPSENIEHDQKQLDKALIAVDGLCGKCDDAHDDSCFVNQARRVLIAAKTGVDLGSNFDGRTTLQEMLDNAAKRAEDIQQQAQPAAETTPAAKIAPEPECNQSELDQLREQDIFRSTLIDEVVNTIESVTDGNYARAMPIHDDEQLGKLAKAFNLMLSTIKKSMSELDTLVGERTSELKQIMNTVPLGLLTIDTENRVMPEHSRQATLILNHETIRGRNFLDLLGITRRLEKERAEMEEFLEVIRMGMLSDSDLAPLNPFPEFELIGDNGSKWLDMRYSAVRRQGEPTGEILIEMADITERKRLAAEVDASQKENLQLKIIAEDPDLFKEFLAEVMNIQRMTRKNLEQLHTSLNWQSLINEMFRGIHTIKGAAGSFGLSDLAEVAGRLENSLSTARSATTLENSFIQGITDSLGELDTMITHATEIASNVLGEDFNTDGPTLRIELSTLKALEKDLAETQDLAQTISKLQRLRTIPANKALSRSVKIIPDLIRRLEKPIDFAFSGTETMIDIEVAQELNTALIHLLRNACDHGIESIDERAQAGKSKEAKVTLEVAHNESSLKVIISDDGRGIDPTKIVRSAIKKGVIEESKTEQMSENEKLRLIFRPGFSTANSVTDVSGRGVGLDAVLVTVEEKLGGRIDIESELGQGSAFILTIPLN